MLGAHALATVASTPTGLVTESKTGDRDRVASRISCNIFESASDFTRNASFTPESPGRIGQVNSAFQVDLQGIDLDAAGRGLSRERPRHAGSERRQERLDGGETGVVTEQLGRMIPAHREPPQLRVEEAKKRLERTGKPIDEISFDVGYEDPAHFRRLFKRITQLTPGGYRRRFQMPAFQAPG